MDRLSYTKYEREIDRTVISTFMGLKPKNPLLKSLYSESYVSCATGANNFTQTNLGLPSFKYEYVKDNF